MLKLYRLVPLSVLLTLLFTLPNISQTLDGIWTCAYATTDDGANGTGIQTITATVLAENQFVAMVSQSALPWEEDDACYLVSYTNADSTNGRIEDIAYNTAFKQVWLNGFDQIFMDHARDLASRGNLVFVPNNDPGSNILVFEFTETGMASHPMRMTTNKDPFGTRYLWAIDIDDAGRVYVTTEGDSTKPSEVLIYESPDVETKWSAGYDADPLQTIVLPDNGDARGITVTGDGQVIYVSNYVGEKVYCYVGNADDGYVLYEDFSFTLTDEPVASDGSTLDPGPWGLQIMPDKNILWVACANDYRLGVGYEYGRYYALNPNTGEILDTLDCALWNFEQTGSYSTRSGGTDGDVSAYTSPYNIDFDENLNAYTQSYYGWTVDKWTYSGEFPAIELAMVTEVEGDLTIVPSEFNLQQNYPNPFNPSTTIEFSLVEQSEVSLSVYSLTGELIMSLLNSAELNTGVYKVTFNAADLASGTYIYTISNGKTEISRKMVLLK